MQKHTVLRQFINTIILLLSITLIASCANDNHTRKGADGRKVFYNEKTGWEFALPKEGWQMLDDGELKRKTYASDQFYEGDKTKNNDNDRRIIFGLVKEGSKTNSIFAFTAAHIDNPSGALRAVLSQQYAQYTAPFQGYDAYTIDTTFRTETIAGITFDKAYLSVKAPKDTGDNFYEYTTYSTMIDTLNFGASIISNNKADREHLLQLWRASIASIKAQ